jgi:hypothetical protein
MDSGINMHLAVTKLQDSLQVAEAARAASAAQRPSHKPRLASLVTAWRPRRRAAAAVPPRARSPLGA